MKTLKLFIFACLVFNGTFANAMFKTEVVTVCKKYVPGMFHLRAATARLKAWYKSRELAKDNLKAACERRGAVMHMDPKTDTTCSHAFAEHNDEATTVCVTCSASAYGFCY